MSKREKKKASKVEHTKPRRQLSERQRPGGRARVFVEREWEVQKPAVGGSRDQASYTRMPGASTRTRPLMAVSAVVHSAEMKIWGRWPSWSHPHLGLDICKRLMFAIMANWCQPPCPELHDHEDNS